MTMRISDSYISTLLVGDLNRSLGNLLINQRMAGSMRRVNSFADDPRAVGTIQRYNSLISSNDNYLSNVSRSRLFVDGTDAALQNISEVLADVRVIALRESSAIANDQTMGTGVVEVQNLLNRLMDVLNTSIEGNYIFSGQKTSTPPFERSTSGVVYQGDTNQIFSRTGPNSTMPVNIPGDIFQGTQSSLLVGGVDMAPSIQPTTPLSMLNMGSGVAAGQISVGDGLGNITLVDLTGAATVGDVTAAIAAQTGGMVTGGISADGKSIVLTGLGPLTVTEVGDGATASQLGLTAVSKGDILTGRDIRGVAQDSTLLTDIASLNGSLPLGAIDVTWQGTTYNVDFAGAVSLGDLVTTFNAAVPGMEMEIRDTSIALIGSAPETFTVANADPTGTASALGIAGGGTPVRLFGMLEDLMAALQSGDKLAIRGVTTELAAIEDTVHELLMTNGGRQNDLDWAENILLQRDERLRSNLSLEYDADVAQVAAALSRAETNYQASLLVTSRLYEANLMMYLK